MSEETLGNLGLDDFVPQQAYEAGSTINVKCIDAEFKDGVSQKNGKAWEALSLVLVPVNNEAEFPEIVNPGTIYHMIFLPTAEADARQINAARGNIKRVYDAIGTYPEGGIPKVDDFKEQTFSIVVKNSTTPDGAARNDVKKFEAAL